ncbi:unnamed protein product [Moneuplotes crassus]|uniref:Alpha/beta hydrolase fold-3 domain-containing protein n=1 Tax=Euplotes crassus TaxID=5936 RepID=A0AAD1Y6U7_EUPCR|nr:unnamed protein product [Moneuplotes crassus]
MDILFGTKKEKTVLRDPREAFHSSEKVVEKLMQPMEKIHVYTEDDLIRYLRLSFDLIVEVDKEMGGLVKMSNYPNFGEKCDEFKRLCVDIKELVNISVDNLAHFSSFSRFDELKQERDRAEDVFCRLGIFCDSLHHKHKEPDERGHRSALDDQDLIMSEDVHIDSNELEEAHNKGMFEDLSLDSEEIKGSIDTNYTDLLPSDTQISLNKLILKKIDNMKTLAKERNHLQGTLHEQRVKDIREGKFKICVPAVALIFKYMADLFKIIKKTMKEAIEERKEGSFKTFMIYASKFLLISEMLFAAFYAKDDMLYKDISDESWDMFFNFYDCYEPKDLTKFNRQYQNICNFQALGAAFISKAGTHSNAFSEFLGQARYAAYYLFFKKERMEQFNMFMSDPDIDLCLKIYNMPETAFMQAMTAVTLPSIQMHKVVYLPMLEETITLRNLKETAESYQDYLKKKAQGLFYHEILYEQNKEKKEKKTMTLNDLVGNSLFASASMRVCRHDFSEDFDKNEQSQFLTDPSLYDPEKNVMVRVLSPFKLPVNWETRKVDQTMIEQANKNQEGGSFFSGVKHTIKELKEGLGRSKIFNFWKWGTSSNSSDQHGPKLKKEAKTPVKEYIDVKAILVHIHGGGFVSMSSFSHQGYTREYANGLGIPVFSIDYRLAPEDPYPAALNDVWQAYSWLVTNCTTQFGIKPSKIIVTGDSAGGNLACALTMLCIEKHFRVPDFLLPAYPVLNMSLLNFSPSLILSLDDYILPTGFLMVFIDAYVKDADAENDHFLSPGICPQNVLEKFPPTRIMTAGNDPLRDEQYRFVLKLIDADVDIRCKEYLHFPHGFLSMNLPVVGLEESRNCIDQAIAYFKESFDREPLECECSSNCCTLVEGRPICCKNVLKSAKDNSEGTDSEEEP